jgi:hypothetical protein
MFRISGPFKAVLLIIFTLCCALSLNAAEPKGWFLSGSNGAEYATGDDPKVTYDDRASAYLKSIKPSPEGFGTVMQEMDPSLYLGKRVRFSGYVKTENVRDWAGLWLRFDRGTATGALDNMQNRPIKGTMDWQRYEVVLDVPIDATKIAFGALLVGGGNLWLNGARIEVVGSEVPITQPRGF